jgi:hypothetical protein
MDAVFPGLVTAGSYHASLVSAYQHGFPLERRVIDYFDRHEKGIEVEMGDMRSELGQVTKVVLLEILKLENFF